MPSIDFFGASADVCWPVTRGDDENLPMQFFATYVRPDDAGNVPLDITGRTYVSSVSTGRGGTVVCNPTVVVDGDPTLGSLVVSLTDAQSDLLTNSRYIWDLVENPGTTSESTLIVGRMTVSGRATV